MSVYRVWSIAAAVMGPLALLLAVVSIVVATDKSRCKLLDESVINRPKLWLSVNSFDGKEMKVSLLWGSEPARAASALLAAQLRHLRLYKDVQLQRRPHDTAALAANVTHKAWNVYPEYLIGVSTAWKPKVVSGWKPFTGKHPGLAGPRLGECGMSPVPARRRLFAWQPEHERNRSTCLRPFHANALADCDFIRAPLNNDVVVYVLGDDECEEVQGRLLRRAEHSGVRLRVQRRNRAGFESSLHSANHSFLFLDYDMWEGVPGVSVVEPPPCVSVNFDCRQELDPVIAMRVADVRSLEVLAPQIMQCLYDFQPSQKYLRLVLEQQASGVDIEEAACDWMLNNNDHVISYEDKLKYDMMQYIVYAFRCRGDSDRGTFNVLKDIVQDEINNHTLPEGSNITIEIRHINCSDQTSMINEVKAQTRSRSIFRMLGIVLLTALGTVKAAPAAAAEDLPFVLADVAQEDVSASSTWRLGPRPRHLASALLHFVREMRWTRLAVLSQHTTLAQHYNAALKEGTDIVFGDFPITTDNNNITRQQAQKLLQDLKDVNARIVFINADARAASTILAAAVAAHMGYADGFVWIVRDWEQNNDTCRTKHFTVSSWIRGVEDMPLGEGNATLRDKLNNTLPHPWPTRAVSLAEALLTLAYGSQDVFQKYPNTRQGLRSPKVIQSLKESLISKPVIGVSQQLRFKERSIEETFVFVDQWCGGNITHHHRLAKWRVNATSGTVRSNSAEDNAFSPPADMPRYDGASGCIVRSGDAFSPTCHDRVCICALLLLALAPVAALLARRALQRHLARLKQEQQIEVIARRRHVATVLAAYLVERAALELHEELGAGRFGSVRLAQLREPARTPRYIAAKALRENAAPAEESEFLREACTIASLEHAHIVRLVGVCIADGPPLVLMELAFFGDLLGYLRARRHLMEGMGSEVLEAPAASGEVEHVSAAALTRLAREAAEALQYLSVRGVVHRDVRAANCLVDVRRSLKLADFGMARDTVAGADGAPEYACRRRGLFPVLWMAPESLAHGVFSGASDVWALGVLVLELVTLGARPYGTMSPLRVLEYVAAGGSPPLPLDATPQTRGLARLCWARVAERRPSAAEVAAYLAARPLALHPALLSECHEPADADSGFGESPSTELLPPDSPLHSLGQLDSLAATH